MCYFQVWPEEDPCSSFLANKLPVTLKKNLVDTSDGLNTVKMIHSVWDVAVGAARRKDNVSSVK